LQSPTVVTTIVSLVTLLLWSYREGIVYALDGIDNTSSDPPYNLDFLEILAELSSRLIEVDRSGNKGLLVYLKEQLPEELTVEWEPLMVYQASLTGRKGADDTTSDKRRSANRQTGRLLISARGNCPFRFSTFIVGQPLNDLLALVLIKLYIVC